MVVLRARSSRWATAPSTRAPWPPPRCCRAGWRGPSAGELVGPCCRIGDGRPDSWPTNAGTERSVLYPLGRLHVLALDRHLVWCARLSSLASKAREDVVAALGLAPRVQALCP
jgi:hypothetical protein